MPRLKVCGIADAAFAVEAARCGVDYLGLIFAEGSPRRVTEVRAREIVGAVRQAGFSPRFVGVFVKHPVAEIADHADDVSRQARSVADEAQSVSASSEEQAAGMDEIASSSRSLARLSAEMQQMVKQFKWKQQ